MMTRTFILVLSLTVLSGCSLFQGQQEIAPCIKESQHDLLIEWGTYENFATRTGAGYELTSRGELIDVRVESDTSRDHLTWVDHRAYCDMAEYVNSTFLKVQALHSPGTRGRFIRYSNPATRVYLQAVWNPDLETFQSRDMRRLYDDLMRLVPTDAE